MKTKITLILFLLGLGLNAQSIENPTFSNGGEFQSSGTYSINATIGESIVGTITNSETLNQGFWAGSYAQNVLNISGPTVINSELKIFPNPVKDVLNIEMQNVENASFTIYTIDGKKISNHISNGNHLNTINLNELSSGIYVLQTQLDDSTISTSVKFLKQ